MADRVLAVHHISLTVADLSRSKAWYQRVFGVVEQFKEEREGRKASVLRFPGIQLSLGLCEYGGQSLDRFDHRNIGLDHAAFTIETREELVAWARRLDDLGVEHSGVIEIPTGGILNLKDPDGIQLAFFWDR